MTRGGPDVQQMRPDGELDEPGTPGPEAKPPRRAMPVPKELGHLALVVLVVLCGVTLFLGYANKDRCTGPTYGPNGQSVDMLLRGYRDVCYSDIQYLWTARGIDQHLFPYLHGGIDAKGQLYGGSVEYPVLTGVLMWLGSVYAHNDHQFLLYSALLLAPFGLVTAWLLGKLSRWRALLWAIGPPLVLYAFHNWDLAVAACAVGAVYVVHRGWGRAGANRSLVTRGVVAAVLLGLGFAFKLYPAIFTLPLMLYVLTGGPGGRDLPAGKRWHVRGAVVVGLTVVATAVLVNLPFMLIGFRGWRASFTFQELRDVDLTTNSIWFWGFRPFSDPSDKTFQGIVDILSPTLIVVAFVVACVLGWLRYRKDGTYPWVAVSAAMLCGFLLFHKVHSPQYTLWLVPMFALLRIRSVWIVLYYLADIAMCFGIFRYYYALTFRQPSGIYDGLAAQATAVGVWGRAALLVVLFFVFLAAPATPDEVDTSPAAAARRAELVPT
ncbi:MAG TPA: glycosyltransferase 87 family protein [Pseudonocardiaceae bacterium]|nr:glycosyltransferase 87 family protein [Pseudonocardiaceae bacterium]